MKIRQTLENKIIGLGSSISMYTDKDQIMEFVHVYKGEERLGHLTIYNSHKGTEIEWTNKEDE